MARAWDISRCARPNILALRPYTSPRFEYPDESRITLLDANENPFGPSVFDVPAKCEATPATADFPLQAESLRLNRYPDAQQIELRQMFCDLRNVDDKNKTPLEPRNVCLGVGSDESIDGIIRAFCVPGRDKILTTPPTYGMYRVSADVNDVGVVHVELDAENGFALRPAAIKAALSSDPTIKVVFLCSPGNPSGNPLSRNDVLEVLETPGWNGVFVVDEAYIDFASPRSSFAAEVNSWPNLIVTQTLSKAFGLAGIRLGVTFSQPEISNLLNNLKGPYNMSAPTVALAKAALRPSGIARMEKNREKMIEQRERLSAALIKIPGVQIIGGINANFILARFLSKSGSQGGTPDNKVAVAVSYVLTNDKNILVRYRGGEFGCAGCLRISVGTEKETDILLETIRSVMDGRLADT